MPVLDFNFGIHAVYYSVFAMHQLEGIAHADFIRFGVELQLHRQQMVRGNAGRVVIGGVIRAAGVLRVHTGHIRSDAFFRRLRNEIAAVVQRLVHMPRK